jgi:hypothetical protein
MNQPEDDLSVIQNCYLLLNTNNNGSDSTTKILGNLHLWFFFWNTGVSVTQVNSCKKKNLFLHSKQGIFFR